MLFFFQLDYSGFLLHFWHKLVFTEQNELFKFKPILTFHHYKLFHTLVIVLKVKEAESKPCTKEGIKFWWIPSWQNHSDVLVVSFCEAFLYTSLCLHVLLRRRMNSYLMHEATEHNVK